MVLHLTCLSSKIDVFIVAILIAVLATAAVVVVVVNKYTVSFVEET